MVYVVKEKVGGHCKIGIARDPKLRLKSLQCGNPRRLALIYSQAVPDKDARIVEAYAHSILAADFDQSNEWFRTGWQHAITAVRTAAELVGTKQGSCVSGAVPASEENRGDGPGILP